MTDSCNQKTMAAILGVTAKTLQSLTSQGVVPRQPDGEYNLALAVQAYLQHREGTAEWRKARIAALQQQTVSASLRTRRQLREMLTAAEMEWFTNEVEGVCIRLWTAVATLCNRELANHIGHDQARRVTFEIDALAKDELGILHERLRLMRQGMSAGNAEDDARLDRLQAELAGEPAPKPRKKAAQ